MDAKELVQIIKKMFSRRLTPSERLKLADEKQMHRLLLRQWDKFFGSSIEDKKVQEEIWANVTDICWSKTEGKRKPRKILLKYRLYVAAACCLLVVGTWALFNNQSSLETITMGPFDKRMTCTLPDSSAVWLTVGSKLSYQEDFLANRKVILQGEASFDVRKKMGSPFQVYFHDAFVEVKGTEFNIKSNDKIAEVTLFTGRIEFQAMGRTIEIKPSQQIIYYIDTKKIESEYLDIEGYNWRTEEYNFADKPLGELINFINSTYHTEVRFANRVNRENLFTGTIHKDEKIEKVLRKICISFDLKSKLINDTIVLY